jgi:uncharacterized protein (TIGR00369 family)
MDKNQKDEELFTAINGIFNERIPFNKVLGLKVDLLRYDLVKLKFEMHDELIGNYMRGTLHGGVISSAIDVTGGLAAFMDIQQKLPAGDLDEKLERFSKLGTIDLRVDYLRPGIGKKFVTTGYTMRTGNRVAVARIELNNEQDALIAVGTGSYIVA